MNCTVLFASPRPGGNTAALLSPFQEELGLLGTGTERFDLYGMQIAPCRACRRCQGDWSDFSCAVQDDMGPIYESVGRAELLVLATPIYSWYCTAPMKAALDRLVYGGCKYYGEKKGPSLLKGKKMAALVTCGYPPEKGADLFEQGMARWCRHTGMDWLGLLARRHLGYDVPFMDEEKARAARDFAHRLYIDLEAKNGWTG